MVKTKDIEIDYNGKPEKVVLKELSYGELMELIDDVMVVDSGMNYKVKSIGDFMLKVTQRSIDKAPFPNTIDEIKKLDKNLGQMLFRESIELNPLG